MVTPIPAMSALVAVNPLIAAVLYVLPGVNVGLFTTGAATALPRQANVSEVERRLAFSLFMSVPKNIFRRFEGCVRTPTGWCKPRAILPMENLVVSYQ
jgi:hypothetical protein